MGNYDLENVQKAKEQFELAAQTIADNLEDYLEDNMEGLKIRFPRGVIRPLREHYKRWPYLDQQRKRTVACAFQVVDFCRWHLNIWDIGLTAGTMWEFLCTIPIVAVIETLLYEFAVQFGYVQPETRFKKTINTLNSKGVINNRLKENLHNLREMRNTIHLFLRDDIEMYNGKPENYNKAVRVLHETEKQLHSYWDELEKGSTSNSATKIAD